MGPLSLPPANPVSAFTNSIVYMPFWQEELVGVMTSRRGYEANLPVIRAADEMMGTLLDTFA